jgi:hypothetical protein
MGLHFTSNGWFVQHVCPGQSVDHRSFQVMVHLPQTTLLALAWRIGAADKR